MSSETLAKEFIDKYVGRLRPLHKKSQLAWWNAYSKGDDVYFKEAEELSKEIKKMHNDEEDFEKVKDLLKTSIEDSLVKRQLKIIYYEYLMSQGDLRLINEIISKESEAEKEFNHFRAKVNGEELTDNDIRNMLKNETNSEELKEVWEASKKQGELVEKDVLEIVRLRNKLARSLGFDNYYIMSLEAKELSVEKVKNIFDELEKLTEKSFKEVKDDIDESLVKKFSISKEELKPWHYHNLFFQEGPEIYKVNLDEFYNQDIVEICKKFYLSIGINVNGFLERSDLYEKSGKSQHAFAIDIDREGDVRILCNIKNSEYWANTTMHECGHAIYDEFLGKNLPFMLKRHAHVFVTEAIAMLFGRQSKNMAFIKRYSNSFNEDSGEASGEIRKMLKLSQLVFSRWTQVMVNFERGLYENPDQDLNKIWWELVKRFQLIDFFRDKPDWASKIHLVSAPVYYHNYMLGEMFASQLHNKITKEILKEDSLKNVDYSGNAKIGKYLKENIFELGMIYPWNELVEKATGEKLTPKYFIEEFSSS